MLGERAHERGGAALLGDAVHGEPRRAGVERRARSRGPLNVIARLSRIVPPILFGLGFLGLWEGAVRGFNLKPYFLAPPSKIIEQFWSNISRIWEAASVSGMNALVGLVVGIERRRLGVGLGDVVVERRRMRVDRELHGEPAGLAVGRAARLAAPPELLVE